MLPPFRTFQWENTSKTELRFPVEWYLRWSWWALWVSAYVGASPHPEVGEDLTVYEGLPGSPVCPVLRWSRTYLGMEPQWTPGLSLFNCSCLDLVFRMQAKDFWRFEYMFMAPRWGKGGLMFLPIFPSHPPCPLVSLQSVKRYII